LLAAGCSISERKSGDREKVDIRSPLGGMKVETNIDPKDVGLAIYPGARIKPSEDQNRDKSANVNIDTPFFKLKVVALDYLSDDSPDKVIDFYKKDMTRYGKVITCAGAAEGRQYGSPVKRRGEEMRLQLNCDDVGSGNSTELKAGEGSSQHIVGITPNGKGTEFGVVYIQLHGQGETM
jgi:hypothetical protein